MFPSSTLPRTLRAAGLVLGAWLALSAPWMLGCQPDPEDRPASEASSGDEIGNPDLEPATPAISPDPTAPIDTNNPEERTPTVNSPPETPPEGE